MATNLLVVTPSPNFGELIRRSLEETENYRVFIVNSKASAIVRADEESCKMAFLDLDMGEQWVEDVGKSLRTVLPEIDLFVLSQNETPPALDNIRPWTLVRKPFQPADLVLTVTQHIQNPVVPPPADSSKKEEVQDNLPWMNDVSKAAQHLTRLTLESSSQAALITRNGELWAYAGQLPQDAAKEIVQALVRNWSAQKGSDLLRFVRLESTKAEHMLYATELAQDVLLAMVFDAETPFSTIRSQAGQLVTSLDENEAKEEKNDKPASPKNSAQENVGPITSEVESDESIAIPLISEILIDIPTPDPKPVAASNQLSGAPALRQTQDTASGPDRKRPADLAQTRPSIFSYESSPPIPLKDLLTTDQQPVPTTLAETRASQSTLDGLEVTAPSKSQPRPETPIRTPKPGELDETRPHSVNEVAERIVLEPVSAGMYHLTYACLLVPRFTSHYLTGDIADRLSEWLPHVCVSFGWRLEHLAVRPEYLQWIVNVAPATSPGYLMRVMRQQTSDKVFNEFPRLKKENPSGDFWAPGYLIMGGTQPHPPQLVKDYIKQIRTRQGIEKPRH
ncbi:MAG: IS200/IS605 family transposase [Chloroflexi bacterium]|nr:IS200/IS605 family transposase [Chloroflexota bacterium]